MITLDHSPVHSDSEILSGTLVFRNTRVPAQNLLDYLADGISMDEFLENFPSVKENDAEAFLKLVMNEKSENRIR